MGNYCKSMGVGNTVDSASYAEATDHSTSAPLLVQAGWILTFQIIFWFTAGLQYFLQCREKLYGSSGKASKHMPCLH